MKSSTMNSVFRLLCPAIALFCLLLPAHFAGAAPPAASPTAAVTTINGLPVVVKKNSVSITASASIDVNESKSGFLGDPVALFTALLKTYPHVRFAAISCESSNPLSSSGAHILYDRVKHTLTVASYGGFNDSGTFGEKVRFTSVREPVFAAIVNAHPKGFSENDPEYAKIADAHAGMDVDWGGFQLLYQPRYGCRSNIIRYHHLISE